MAFTGAEFALRDRFFHSFDVAPTGSQVKFLIEAVGSVTIDNTPFVVTNIESGTATATSGASVNTSNLTRKTVHITALTNGSGTGAGSQLFVNIEASHNGGFDGEEDRIDRIRYESGTATQTDIFSYDEHLPFIRTSIDLTNVGAVDVSTVITGRGV